MDPTNPRILYAAFWDHQRLPWQVRSGGPGSGIWKSTDGGDTWTRLSEGLPKLMGKIGVAVSPANPDRVFAIVEAEKGGLYRSDDAGQDVAAAERGPRYPVALVVLHERSPPIRRTRTSCT